MLTLDELPEPTKGLISGLSVEQSWVVLGLVALAGLWLIVYLWRAGDR